MTFSLNAVRVDLRHGIERGREMVCQLSVGSTSTLQLPLAFEVKNYGKVINCVHRPN